MLQCVVAADQTRLSGGQGTCRVNEQLPGSMSQEEAGPCPNC